jgi:hypothetical protein
MVEQHLQHKSLTRDLVEEDNYFKFLKYYWKKLQSS